jgi:hypothetical protein
MVGLSLLKALPIYPPPPSSSCYISLQSTLVCINHPKMLIAAKNDLREQIGWMAEGEFG